MRLTDKALRLLERVDDLVARAPFVIVRRSVLQERQRDSFLLGVECAAMGYRPERPARHLHVV